MPSDTPKYGGAKVDLLRAAGQIESVQPQIEQIKEKVKAQKELTDAAERVQVVEQKVTGSAANQVTARSKVTAAIEEQSAALEANSRLLARESGLIAGNTEAWLANARARREAALVKPGLATPGPVTTPAKAAALEAQQATTVFAPPARQVQQIEQAAQTQVRASRDAAGAMRAEEAALVRLGEARARVARIPDYSNVPLKLTKPAGGSTGAYFAQDAQGVQYLLKTASQNQVASELLGNAIYRELGIPTPQAGTYNLGGQSHVAYPTVSGTHRPITRPNSAISQNVAADALIGNRDFIGLTDDNILFDRAGNPIRIDQGASFKFRAQGGRKEFGPVPGELESLLSFNPNKVSASNADLRAQTAAIARHLTPDRVSALVSQAPFSSPAYAKEIEDTLNKRIAAYAEYAKGAETAEAAAAAAAQRSAATQVSAGDRVASQAEINAAKIAAAQKKLIESYNLSYGERAALSNPLAPKGGGAGNPFIPRNLPKQDSEGRPVNPAAYTTEVRERFYQRLYQKGLIEHPKGGALTGEGRQLQAALAEQPGAAIPQSAIAAEEALAYKIAPRFNAPAGAGAALVGSEASEIATLAALRHRVQSVAGAQDELHTLVSNKKGRDNQLKAVKKYIEERSRGIAEAEGIIQGGTFTAYRAGPVGTKQVDEGVFRASERPIPHFVESYKQQALPYERLPAAALRAYGPAVLRPGFSFEEEQEMTVSARRAKQALLKRAQERFSAEAVSAATVAPGAVEGLGAQTINDLLLTRLYEGKFGGNSPFSGSGHHTQAARVAQLAERGLAEHPGKLTGEAYPRLTGSGAKVADELLRAEVLGYGRYKDPYTQGATGTDYGDAYPGRGATPEQARLAQQLQALRGTGATAAPPKAEVERAAARLTTAQKKLIVEANLYADEAEALTGKGGGIGQFNHLQDLGFLRPAVQGAAFGTVPGAGSQAYTGKGFALKKALEAHYANQSIYTAEDALVYGEELKARAHAKSIAPYASIPTVPVGAPSFTKGITSSGVVVRDAQGRLVLVDPKGAYGGYPSTFPKGQLEPGLTLQQNALKELHEETGLRARITGYLGDFESQHTGGVTRFFTGEHIGGRPLPRDPSPYVAGGSETARVRFVTPDEAKSLLTAQRDQEILRAAVQAYGTTSVTTSREVSSSARAATVGLDSVIRKLEALEAESLRVGAGGGGGRPPRLPPTALAGEEPPEGAGRFRGQYLLGPGPVGGYGVPPVNELGGARSFVAGRGGVEEKYTRGFGEERVAIGEFTKAEEAMIASTDRAFNGIGKLGGQQARFNAIMRQSSAEVSAASSALTRHGALSTEYIGALARGEVTLREFGDATVATVGKFAGWAVAGGLVYGAYDALKHITEGAKAAATGVTQLERADIPNFSRKRAESSFLDISRQLNVPIGGKGGVAEAEFYATRAGFRTQPEAEKAATTALEAQKLDQVPIQDATKSLGALKTAFGLNAEQIHHVFEELDVGQLRFNARLNQTLPQLGRAASAVANAGGNVHELVQQLVTITGATGGGGGTGGGNPATFFLREGGNIRKPGARSTLEQLTPDIFQRELADPNITRFNKELAERAGSLSKENRLRVAEAIGGGTAIGGRYAIALLNSGPSGRLGEVERQVGSPGQALNQDLQKKLAQFDEQVARIGHTFERIGIEIGKVGLTSIAENVIAVFGLMAGTLEILSGPLGRIGELFNAIPGPIQQAIIALGALSVATKFNRSDKVLGLSQIAANAVGGLPGGQAAAGYLFSPDKRFDVEVKRTLSEQENRDKKSIEESAQNKEKQAKAFGATLAEKTYLSGRLEKGALTEVKPGAYRAYGVGAQEAQALVAVEARAAQQAAALAAADEGLVVAQERLIETRRFQSVANSKLPRSQRAALLAEEGIVAGAGGRPLRGATGLQGSYYEALQNQGRAGGIAAPGSRIEKEMQQALAAEKTATVASAEGAVLWEKNVGKFVSVSGQQNAALEEQSVALEEQAAIEKEGAVSVKQAIGELVAAITEGAASVGGAGLTAALGSKVGAGGKGLWLEGGAAEAGLAGAATGSIAKILQKVGGVGGSIAGSFDKGGLLKGFNYALFGSLGAELAGNAIGGKTGSKVSSLGSGVAIGAGLGVALPFIGGPLGGAVIGGAIGGGLSLAKDIFGGGGPSHAVSEQLQRQKALDAQFQHIGKGAGSGGALEEAAAVWSQELETAFGTDQKAAEAAQKTIDKSLKVAAANLKLFPSTTPRGGTITKQLLAESTATVEQIVKNPNSIEQNAGILENIEQAVLAPAEQQLAAALKRAKTPGQVNTAVTQAQTIAQQLYQANYAQPKADIAKELRDKLAERDALEKKYGVGGSSDGIAHLRGRQPDRGERPEDASAALERLRKEDPRLKAIPKFNDKGQTESYSDYEAAIKAYEARKKSLETSTRFEGEAGKKLVAQEKDIAHKVGARAKLTSERQREERGLVSALKEPRAPTLEGATKQETKVSVFRKRISEYREDEQKLSHEIDGVQREKKKLEAQAVSKGTINNPGVRKKLEAMTAEIEALKAAQQTLAELGPQVYNKLQEFAKESAVLQGIETVEAQHKSGDERKLAEAGPDPAAKRKVQREIDERNRKQAEGLPFVKKAGGLPKSRTDAEVEKRIEEQEAEVGHRVELETEKEHHDLARLPANATPQQIAGIKARGARERAATLRDGVAKHRATQSEANNAENEELEAAKEGASSKEATTQEAKQKKQEAKERYEEKNRRAEERINAQGDLAESRTQDPLKQAKIKLHTDKAILPLTSGDTRLHQLATINRDEHSYTEQLIQSREADIEFNKQMETIGNDTAIRQYRALLKVHGISKATRRDLLLKIKGLEDEETAGDLGLGSIVKPTLYDVRYAQKAGTFATSRELAAVYRGAGGPPRIASERDQPSSGSHPHAHIASPVPIFHQINHVNVKIVTNDPNKMADGLHRIYRSNTKSLLRRADLAGV